eukprot:1189064-Prorocentrum_minimum.AAC.1
MGRSRGRGQNNSLSHSPNVAPSLPAYVCTVVIGILIFVHRNSRAGDQKGVSSPLPPCVRRKREDAETLEALFVRFYFSLRQLRVVPELLKVAVEVLQALRHDHRHVRRRAELALRVEQHDALRNMAAE